MDIKNTNTTNMKKGLMKRIEIIKITRIKRITRI